MKILPALWVINEYFYDDGVDLRWKKPTRYGILPGDLAGSLHSTGYIYVKFKQENYRVHRILWMMRTGEDPGELEIDHKNRNRADNSDGNLRLVGKVAQAQNKGLYRSNRSGYSGVSEHRNGWDAYIDHEGKRTPLGRFNTKEEAIAARKGAEITVRGALRL